MPQRGEEFLILPCVVDSLFISWEAADYYTPLTQCPSVLLLLTILLSNVELLHITVRNCELLLVVVEFLCKAEKLL